MFHESAADDPPHRLHPVPDVVGYLLGRWSVERTVYDRRAEVEGRFRGTVDFRTAHIPGVVLQEDEGRLTWNGKAFPASRSLRRRARADGTASVEFADGRPFHALDLRTGAWSTVHPCAPDRYEGSFAACSADEWHQEWRVSGPAKDQLLRSVHQRLAG